LPPPCPLLSPPPPLSVLKILTLQKKILTKPEIMKKFGGQHSKKTKKKSRIVKEKIKEAKKVGREEERRGEKRREEEGRGGKRREEEGRRGGQRR
jgi:hypothetical protein